MKRSSPTIAMLGLGTAVPPYQLDQEVAAERLAQALGANTEAARWAKRLFRNCGVKTRYTCEPNLLESPELCTYLPGTPFEAIPTTTRRMKIYQEQSVPLAIHAAKQALAESGIDPLELTHIVTVSCTGQFLPGLDTILIRELDLSSDIGRMPLTFLGCAAGMTAVRLARQMASANVSYKILIICVELCTIHVQPSSDRESLFATGFFGDGAAACIVGTAQVKSKGIFELGVGHSVIFPDSSEDMVWTVGDHGFNLYLSPRIPELLAKFSPKELSKLIGDGPFPELWAIHPGGRGIIDALQKLFSLTDEQTKASRSVLSQYGNVSSATILFVMHEMKRELEKFAHKSMEGIAVAFGPGINAEMMKITYHPVLQIPSQVQGEAHA